MKAIENKSGIIFDVTDIDYKKQVVTLGGCRYRFFYEVTFLEDEEC